MLDACVLSFLDTSWREGKSGIARVYEAGSDQAVIWGRLVQEEMWLPDRELSRGE